MTLDPQELRNHVRWLRGEDGVVPESQAISVLARVLKPLLSAEGFELSENHDPQQPGVDLVAKSSAAQDEGRVIVGIEYKHRGGGRPIGVETVKRLLSRTASEPYKRLMLIGRFGFTDAARETARRFGPVAVELLDLVGIEAWIRRFETGQPSNAARVQLLIRSLSHEFATLVAADPETLDHIEWRDLERLMARVMEGLGFKVILTPPSKDGGKDLILVCAVSDGEQSFIVELKHWRAGKKVGRQAVSDFMQVIVAENRSGGLFLSTSGYAADTFEGLTEITRQRLRLGDRTKVVLLAQTYVRACCGLWSPPADLPKVLFNGTL